MGEKLKVLCLHGCMQNALTFKKKIGSFRKNLKSLVEFEFVESPHLIDFDGSIEEETERNQFEPRSWWFTSTNRNYVSKVPSDVDTGFQQSVDIIQEFVKEKGPFDGLLGFSQGATLAALICSLIHKGKFSADFKFVVVIAGFESLCKPHEDLYFDKLCIPSLHVIGDSDNVISKERSEKLLELFENKEVLRHSGGHYVPASNLEKETYKQFFSKFKSN